MVSERRTSQTSRSKSSEEAADPAGWLHRGSASGQDDPKGPPTTTKELEKHPDDDNTDDGATHPTPTQYSQLPFSKARTIALVIVLTGAAFLNTLSIQACVIILPTIGDALNIPSARQQWVVSAYSLTFGCFLLLWGRLADVYGKRMIFIYGSAWFCVVTLLCPFIPNEVGFEIFRGLQGLGAAANVPTAIGILGVTFQPGKAKNYAFAMYSAGAPMGSVIGNMLGGVVGQYATWKAVFWVLAGLAAIITVAGHLVIPVPQVAPKKSDGKNAVDWPGGILVTVGLVVLLFALTEGNVVGWQQAYIPVLIVVSVSLMAAFVCWQVYLENRTSRRPLMKVSLFRNMRVSAAMAVMALFFAAFNNFLVFATYFYQDYQGHDAIETTIRFIPTGVVGVMTIFVSSQILARINVNYILMFGTLCCSISCLLFAVPIAPSTTYWAYGFPAMCLSVFGADTLFPALLLLTAHSLPKEDQAIGGALINAVGQIGRAIGLAVATAIQVAVQGSKEGSSAAATGTEDFGNASFLAGLRSAEWFSFAMCIVAFIIATACFRQVGKVGASKK